MFPRALSLPIARFAASPTGHVVLSFSLRSWRDCWQDGIYAMGVTFLAVRKTMIIALARQSRQLSRLTFALTGLFQDF